jgi:hypothetical protein
VVNGRYFLHRVLQFGEAMSPPNDSIVFAHIKLGKIILRHFAWQFITSRVVQYFHMPGHAAIKVSLPNCGTNRTFFAGTGMATSKLNEWNDFQSLLRT